MTELVIPLRDEAALRQDVALRAGRLRRRRRSAAASVVGVGLVAALLVGTPSPWRTSLRTTDPRTTPAQEGSSEVEIEPGTVVDDVRPGPPPRPVVARAGETSAVTNPLPPTATGGGPERTMHSPVPRMAFGRAGGVWEMAADGTGLRSLRGFAADPAWSPDGRRLAYTDEFQGVGDWKYVAVLDIETGESQPLALPAEFESFDPAWSPDGRYVVLTTRSQPWATPPDLTLQVRVFDLVTRSVWSVGVGQEAAWSPDGRIVHRCDDRLCVVGVDGAHRTTVPQSEGLRGPAWSPDSQWIAAVDDSGRLLVFRPDGSGRRVVVDGVSDGPGWFPDSARLAYPSDSGIRSVRLDGSDVRAVTDRATDRTPVLVADRRTNERGAGE